LQLFLGDTMQRKVKDSLKNKGLKNAPYDKMDIKQGNSSDQFAPCHDQGSAPKVKHDHKIVKDEK
jgi:hypothetical protein